MMTEPTPTRSTPNADPTPAYKQEVSPDALMSDFRGKPIIRILIFTVIIHVCVIGVFSFGYLKEQVLGEDTSQLSEQERLEVAVREGTTALRKIAERHEISVQDLSASFGQSAPPPAVPAAPEAADSGTGQTPADPADGDKPASEIERALQETAPPPAEPDLDNDLDKEAPIFPE